LFQIINSIDGDVILHIIKILLFYPPLPKIIDLLRAGARVCKKDSLLFLLLGSQNYQWCPAGVRRIGLIYASIVPNYETRALNIYYRFADTKQ
jgi:hypothetical protein